MYLFKKTIIYSLPIWLYIIIACYFTLPESLIKYTSWIDLPGVFVGMLFSKGSIHNMNRELILIGNILFYYLLILFVLSLFEQKSRK